MSLSRWLLRAVAAASLLLTPSMAIYLLANELYSGSHCAGTPNVLKMIETESCDVQACTAHDLGGYTLFVAVSCNVIDRFNYTKERFEENDFVMMEEYSEAGCQKLIESTVYPASGVCERSSALTNESNIVRLYDNDKAVVSNYNNTDCDSLPSQEFQLDREEILNGACMQEHYRFYTSLRWKASDLNSSTYFSDSNQLNNSLDDNGISGGVVATIVVGAVACVGVLAYATFRFIRHRHDNDFQKDTGIAALAASYAGYPASESALNAITLGSESSYSQNSTITEEKTRGRSGASVLWKDEIIITARVPREKVLVQDLISRGGYGEVYAGLFNGERVAVKILLPEMRKSINHLNAFLVEIKLMATLNHERIVHFVGVAWDSLTDLCVLSEYMEGGDLRTLLKNCEEEKTPLGFNRSKAKIALHVAHSLTYLHSLSPPVLHRDLKSKNILLTSQLDAKLTDFGVSRERSDFTMTGGVGSSRWMAPEVMMGDRYDDKADMFSFGVVLAELDQHLLPYASFKDKSNSDRAMPDLAILQLVASGKLRIEFSSGTPKAIRDLGMACVSINSKDRPSAADALYKLHTILAREL